VLREAFDQPYRQISKLLAISEANDRRLAARAALPSRRRTEAGRSAPPAPAIRDSSTSRALTTFEGLLAANVVTSVNGTVAA